MQSEPWFMQDLDESASLQDVIRAINEDRARLRASHALPSLKWSDIAGWDSTTGEPILHDAVAMRELRGE